MQIEQFDVTSIRVGHRLRQVDPAKVDVLAASIAAIGLQTPITVQVMDLVDGDGVITEGVPVLVAGLHRLEAARKLGFDTIISIVSEGSDVDAKLWEIAENLHRADLSQDDRDQHLREWIALTNTKGGASPPLRGGVQPHNVGVHETARALGVDRKTVREAITLGGLTDEARSAAVDAGLTRKEKIEVAREPAEQQSAKVHQISERPSKPAPSIKNAFESEQDWCRALFNVWNRGAQDWRERALGEMDRPVFDNTRFGARG